MGHIQGRSKVVRGEKTVVESQKIGFFLGVVRNSSNGYMSRARIIYYPKMEEVPENDNLMEDEEEDEVDIDDEFEDIEEEDFGENNNFVSG